MNIKEKIQLNEPVDQHLALAILVGIGGLFIGLVIGALIS